MDSRLEKVISECTRPLSDDRELELDIAQELRSHLEDKCDELKRKDVSGDKAVEEAVKEFGDSTEISESLYRANLPRFQFRAKLRLAAKILFFPLLLLGLYFALDLRLIQVAGEMDELRGSYSSDNLSSDLLKTVSRFLKKEKTLNPDERLIVFGGTPKTKDKNSAESDRQRAIWERFPENKVYLANYIKTLIDDPRREYVYSEIGNACKLEPENAAYDYILCGLLLKEALKPSETWKKGDPAEKFYTVRDRRKLDQAMAELKKGMRKPYFRLYTQDMALERMKIMNFGQDFAGQFHRIIFSAGILLQTLSLEREIFRAIPLYANLLISEGKDSEAEFYLDAWKHIIPQFNNDSFTLIDQLVVGSCLNIQHDYAVRRKDARRIKELAIAVEPMNAWRAKSSKNEWEMLRKHAGVLSGVLLPVLKDDVLTPEKLAPERNLNYSLIDSTALAIQAALILLFLLVNAILLSVMYLKGQRPFLILLPWKTVLKIVLFGLLLPVGLYLLYSRIDFLGGHNYNYLYNFWRFLPGILFFMLAPPLAFGSLFWRALKRRGRELGYPKLPLATHCLNVLFVWATALFLIGGIMRPILTWEQDYYVKGDTVTYNGKYFSVVEDRIVEDLNKKQREALEKSLGLK